MSASSLPFNFILLVPCVVMAVFLVRSKMMRRDLWQATLTPLSSIIGSGFLIMAPLLAGIVGLLSPLAILGIVSLAYAIGHVIRFNIQHVEPRLAEGRMYRRTGEIEYLGNVVLVLAYVVAVAFYLSLLSNFLLNYLGVDNLNAERMLTSLIIIFIAWVGYFRGLGGLERLEFLSINVQLSIVLSLAVGLCFFEFSIFSGREIHFDYPKREVVTQFQMLAGVLLVVQGFETSRFLGEKYSREIRVSSMRNAQIISGVLYVLLVILLMPVVAQMNLNDIKLAEIIDAMHPVAFILPLLLMVAALMSQFSAAVADLGGGGGLLRENSKGHLSTEIGYLSVAVCSITLVWFADLFEIITLASRAFATYYFLQTLLALIYNRTDSPPKAIMTVVNQCLFVVLAVILAYIIFFSIPSG